MGRKKLSVTARQALGIPRRIREAREGAGLTPEQMAAFLGIHASVYRRIEAGEVGVSAERLAEIAQLTNKPIGFFYGENEEAEAP